MVVDNASQDNSCDVIQHWINERAFLEAVELIRSAENTGFLVVITQALKAEHYLLLNCETLFRKGAITLILDAVKNCFGRFI